MLSNSILTSYLPRRNQFKLAFCMLQANMSKMMWEIFKLSESAIRAKAYLHLFA